MNERTFFPRHLIDIQSLHKHHLEKIFEKSKYYLSELVLKNSINDLLKGKIVVNLFFESSTRTRNSFEIAAERLGAMVLSPEIHSSALTKGESVLDTVRTFEAMGAHYIVVRHTQEGILKNLSKDLSSAILISAGEGREHHPTQTLIDLFTIQQHKKNWKTLRVALIGDILHSRVAQSLIQGLCIMGVQAIHLIGPQNLLKSFDSSLIKKFHHLEEGLPTCDVIVCLRLQKERMSPETLPDNHLFHQQFGLTLDKLKWAKHDAIVMHPGPMIRNIEIAPEVVDSPQSVIFQQVQNGVAIRMAILDLFLPNRNVS